MNEGITKRIVDIMNAENVSIDTFANKLKIPDTVIKSMLYHQSTPSYEQILRINKTFPKYDLNWLITGDGEMMKGEKLGISHVVSATIGIPHIESVEAFCRPGQGFDVAIKKNECSLYAIPGMEDADFTIKARGRSMINREYPDRSIKEGDYVGLKKCKANILRYGEIYALATSDGVMIKIVKKSEQDDRILLESFNKEEGFESFEYPTVDIYDIAMVVAVASVNRFA